MREIKFRAWDGMNMFNLYNVSRLALHPDLDVDGVFVPFCDHLVVMQYTGRKDKKGVDIYESDIVKIPEHYTGDHLCPVYVAVITYNAPEFQTEPYFDESWNDIEVIGNIHENPELWEVNND